MTIEIPAKTASIVRSIGLLGILFLGISLGLTMVRNLKLLRCLSLMLVALIVGLCQASLAQDYDFEAPGLAPPTTPVSGGVTLFQNVRIFDGKNGALSTPSSVLVRGDTIERISASPNTVDRNGNVRVIAGDGRVLCRASLMRIGTRSWRRRPRYSC